MNLFKARVVFSLFVWGFLVGVSVAQEPAVPSSAPSSASPSAPAPRKKSPSDDRVILKVGEAQVTEAEFESGFFNVGKQQGDPDEKEGPSQKDRRKMGENYAAALALSQKAVADHLDSTPEIKHELAMDRIQVLSDAEYAHLMDLAKPTPKQVSDYYAAHPSEFDEVQIRRLFIWKQHEGAKTGKGVSPQDAKARADQVRQAIASGTDLKTVAAELDKSGDGMLDLNPLPFPRGELQPQMEKVAFSLQEGEWAVVQDTPASLILVQLLKHGHRPLPEVSSLIEGQLQGQKMQEVMDDVKNKAGIWMDKQYFATEGSPVSGAQKHVSSPPTERDNQ